MTWSHRRWEMFLYVRPKHVMGMVYRNSGSESVYLGPPSVESLERLSPEKKILCVLRSMERGQEARRKASVVWGGGGGGALTIFPPSFSSHAP